MKYYEVWVADSRFRADKALTYSYEGDLPTGAVVAVPLRAKMTTAFVSRKTSKPAFETKPIKNVLSQTGMPAHSLPLALWISQYYNSSLGECLRQFAPVKPSLRRTLGEPENTELPPAKLVLDAKLTNDQDKAIKAILGSKAGTTLLRGQTGSGKTRVYLELAKMTIADGKSAIILTPEISLTRQLENAIADYLHVPTYVLHSQLPDSQRKKLWLKILESDEPLVVLGPRSALFAPVKNPGLVVLDEAHEPAYKQESSPRYQATRVASQMGHLTDAHVVLGTATPSLVDYYIASQKKAVVEMDQRAVASQHAEVATQVVDIKDRTNFTRHNYLSNQLLDAVASALADGKQALIYLNRRGSARVILCGKCGWQADCPNCDIPLVYHGDRHMALCHTCGYHTAPPVACPNCKNPDIIYKSIGTKALTDDIQRLFPSNLVMRFDSDSGDGERLSDQWQALHTGKIDILVGTQLVAKGLDLPRLAVVGIVTAESSLSLPDYTAEERTFQLLYQVMGRVGRGHTAGQVVVQSYQPDSPIISAALARNYQEFYKNSLKERQIFKFPPYSYLLKLTIRRASSNTAEAAAHKLKSRLLTEKLPVEIIGPAPSFFGKRGRNYYWQIVAKSKDRSHLLQLAALAPPDWTADLDPSNLL